MNNERSCDFKESAKLRNNVEIKLLGLFIILMFLACSKQVKPLQAASEELSPHDLVSVLDRIWITEQQPIRRRDSLMVIYGAESKEVQEQQEIYKKNHQVNEKKVRHILDAHGWPEKKIIGEQGNWTICNVIQHSDNEVRVKYLPMMRQAVLDKQLAPRFLVRAEDRIATENGQLQIYGGQMKYYPETRSFNVWPVKDPENINVRRAEIGLDPIEQFLKVRFDFDWDLEEQIQRSEAFEAEMKSKEAG
jgi:hypothetical protein